MPTWESRLRADLHELANVAPPARPADRALGRARMFRRRRVMVAAAGSTALVLLIATPALPGIPLERWHLPFANQEVTRQPCESATDEADPPRGVPESGQPFFVKVLLRKLPPRDDYFVQSAQGVCPDAGPPGGIRSLYTVINLGPNREHGHLAITLYYEVVQISCPPIPTAPHRMACAEATTDTPSTPLVRMGSQGPNSFVVTATYPGGKTISIEANGTPLEKADLQSMASDPELADLLP